MRPSAADKEAEKEATRFEDRARRFASVNGKIKFMDFAREWVETSDLAPKTRESYDYLLHRINIAIGHIAIEKLESNHIKRFISNLREPGIKEVGSYAISTSLAEHRTSAKLTQKRLSEVSGVSSTTIGAAECGERILIKTAQKLCAALYIEIEKVFTIENSAGVLSDRTVRHYHKLISTILQSAVDDEILPRNVAKYKNSPKLPRSEAKYLDDEEARTFLTAVLDESDIRVKTVLILDLFTGMRKGELCGLEWQDIDFTDNVIHVRRASQYIAGQGVIEVPTKNFTSTRSIDVSSFVVKILKDYKLWWVDYRFMLGDAWKGQKERLFIQADGKPLFPDTVNYWLSRFNEKNEFPHITPHTFRHTFATLQLGAGVDIRTLQARTGHSQASTLLNVYSHFLQSKQEKAAQAMDDVLLRQPDRKSGSA
jgi:integrase